MTDQPPELRPTASRWRRCVPDLARVAARSRGPEQAPARELAARDPVGDRGRVPRHRGVLHDDHTRSSSCSSPASGPKARRNYVVGVYRWHTRCDGLHVLRHRRVTAVPSRAVVVLNLPRLSPATAPRGRYAVGWDLIPQTPQAAYSIDCPLRRRYVYAHAMIVMPDVKSSPTPHASRPTRLIRREHDREAEELPAVSAP